MHFLLPAIVAAALTFDAAAAIDIILYPSNSSCIPIYTWTCTNVAARTCCRPPSAETSFPYFSSAKCEALAAGQTCTVARVFRGSTEPPPPCGAPCGSPRGFSGCVTADGCWGSDVRQFGAYWSEPAAALDSEAECQGAVEADRVSFADGRAFRIGRGVPTRVAALLVGLGRTDPHLARGVPAEVAPFEIKTQNVNG